MVKVDKKISEFLAKAGRKGGKALLRKRGTAHFSKAAKLSWIKRGKKLSTGEGLQSADSLL